MDDFVGRKIKGALTLADKLKQARKKVRIKLSKAESQTKIPKKYLIALESGNYGKLPEPVYTRGFITRYAELLDLKTETCLSLYEKEWGSFKEAPNKSGVSGDLLRPHANDLGLMNQNQLIVTPEVIWGGLVSIGVLGIFGYIWFAVASFAAAPPLQITSPESEIAVQVEKINISGITDPNAQLEINSQFVTVGNDGHFSEEIRLIDGINTIEISAKNKINKATTKQIQLLADIDEPVYGPFLSDVLKQ